MGHLHRPQVTTPLVFYPVEYYYDRPQTVFGPGGEVIPPSFSEELIEEVASSFDNLEFDSGGGDDGLVLIQDT